MMVGSMLEEAARAAAEVKATREAEAARAVGSVVTAEEARTEL